MMDITTLTIAELLDLLQKQTDEMTALQTRVARLEEKTGALLQYLKDLKELLDAFDQPAAG